MELIFSIVVIGIVASFAVPKYMNTRDEALASTIQRDLVSTTTSVQSYYLVNRKIDNISDAIKLNSNNWTIEAKKITFKEGTNNCAILEIDDTNNEIDITIDKSAGDVCKILDENGITTQSIDLL